MKKYYVPIDASSETCIEIVPLNSQDGEWLYFKVFDLIVQNIVPYQTLIRLLNVIFEGQFTLKLINDSYINFD